MRPIAPDALVQPDPFGEAARPWCRVCEMPSCDCVHGMSETRAREFDERRRLGELLAEAGPDEIRVLRYLAERLIAIGQRQYGRLDVARDTRDMRAEGNAERADDSVYQAIRHLQGRGDHAETDHALTGLKRTLEPER